MTARPRQTV